MSNADLLKNFCGTILLKDAHPALVKAVQEYLVKSGFLNGTIDGKVGPITMAAFHKFKRSHHLGDLDYLGKATAEALLKASSVATPYGVNLKIPYLSQRDNQYHPGGTCNITCVAMCLKYFGVRATQKPQLEDELFLKLQKHGWRRHYHYEFGQLFNLYNAKNTFDTKVPWNRIKAHLAKGNPVIYSGKFTPSGHIIVIRGYDQKGWFVNDPWGEWFSTGYRKKSGENLHYSYGLLEQLSYAGKGQAWAHLPSRKE